MKRTLILLAIGAVVLGATGSSRLVKHFAEEGVEVDGYKLKHRRQVELSIVIDEDLVYYAHVGDIRLRAGGGGEAVLSIELIEYEPGDAEVFVEVDGTVRTRTQSGKPSVLGELIAEVPRGISLELGSGLGDVEIEGMDGSRRILVETGMGDIVLEDLRNVVRVDAETGMGEVLLGPGKNLEEVDLATGMGGIKVRQVEADMLDAATGMGGIRFNECHFDKLYAETGMGSVKLKDTFYNDSDLDTGLGSVKYH